MSTDSVEVALMTECLGSAESAADKLIDRARAGDRAAFNEIVDTHQRRIAATAWRILGNEADARDAAQETFLRAFRYISSFKRGQDLGAWLYRIAVNVCRDTIKKRRRRTVISLDTATERGQLESIAGPDNLESAAILSEERTLVARAIGSLTRKEREAFVLRDFEGLSTEEVARILGSSPATVRSQICSARAKIRSYRARILEARRGGR